MSGCTSIGLTQFWSRVDRSSSNECWEWTGAVNDSGYGVAPKGLDGERRAHRISALLAGMEIAGLCVLHHCDNRLCVNPSHLFLGDRSLNSADKVNKGRQMRGRGTPQAKLSEEDVLSMRERHAHGETQASIAESFGVDPSNVSLVVRGKAWRHVGMKETA